MSNPNGFRPNGDGPAGEKYGRDPETGRAYTMKGTVRRERGSVDLAEQIHAMARKAGNAALKDAPGMESFNKVAGTHRKWVREATRYASADWLKQERARLEERIATLEAKSEACVAWLNTNEATDANIGDDVATAIGQECMAFLSGNGYSPEGDELQAIIDRHLTPEARKRVEASSDPENDPLGEWRRAKSEDESEDDDETLD